MSEVDWRTLCADLAAQLREYDSADPYHDCAELLARADAAVAQLTAPAEEEAPTYEQLYDLAAEYDGEPVESMRAALARWGHPPQPTPPAEALAARPLLEQVARMGDRIGQHTVGEIRTISDQAAAWLKDNPPGQPAAIEPRGCPAPGACSCVETVPPVLVDRRYEFSVVDGDYVEQASGSAPTLEQARVDGLHYLEQYAQDGPHTLELRRVDILLPLLTTTETTDD